jgi:acetyl esterase/lipase
MPIASPKLRRVGEASLFLLGVSTCLAYAPMPVYALWLVRFVVREAALFAAAPALLSVLLLRDFRRWLGVIFFVFLNLPLFLTLPFFARNAARFSLTEYVGDLPQPDFKVQKDLAPLAARPELAVDLYEGKSPAPRPFVLVIHGGSWRGGDKGQVEQISRAIAAAGVSVVDVRYRLSPQHRFPAAVSDVKCVLGALRRDSQRFGLDPRRAALLGRSAGGQLALLAAYSAGDRSLPPSCVASDEPVQAVAAIYPFVDLRAAFEKPPQPDPEETRAVLRDHFGSGADAARADYDRASPAAHVAPRAARPLPPTLLMHGASDMLVPAWHSTRLYESLRQAGQPAELVVVPMTEHGFDFRPGGAAEQLERAIVARFLKEALLRGQ